MDRLKECKEERLRLLYLTFPADMVGIIVDYMGCLNCVRWITPFHKEYSVMKKCHCSEIHCLTCWLKIRKITYEWYCPSCNFINSL